MLLWAAVILVLTSVPGRDVPEVRIPYIDKLVHLSMYGILGALASQALPSVRRLRAFFLVLACGSLFGAADEWHQQFIPGRSQDRYDWVADTIGAALGVLFIAAARARREPAS